MLILSSAFVFAIAKTRLISLIYIFFAHNSAKKETPCLSSWQHYDSFEKICILSP